MRTDEEYAKILKDSMCGDEEIDHGVAEDILLEALKELGYIKLAEAFKKEAQSFWYA